MDVNIKITLSADPELLTHLAMLAGTVQDVLHVSNAQLIAAEKQVQPIPEEKPAKKNPAKKSPKPAKEEAEPIEPEVEPIESAEEKEPEITVEDVRKICMEVLRADPGKKEGVSKAMKACGAEQLSQVPKANLGKLAEMVRAL